MRKGESKMRINDFYSYSRCVEASQTAQLLRGDTLPYARTLIIQNVCIMLQKDYSDNRILEGARTLMLHQYRKEWFVFPWQYTNRIDMDVAIIQRFLSWYRTLKAHVIDSSIHLSVDVPDVEFADGTGVLEDTVSLIIRDSSGEYSAVRIFFSATKRSVRGKSAKTSIAMDLHALVSKYCLERRYPGIGIYNVYLVSPDDTERNILPDINDSGTMQSNIFYQDFKQYYSAEQFNYSEMLSVIKQIVNDADTPNCYVCAYKSVCAIVPLKKMPRINVYENHTNGGVTQYTEAQQQLVLFVDGKMMVCAGPGSGKTAALIGRMDYLMSRGVAPQSILMITFTTEAAEQLISRCSQENCPVISTINALGYRILLENQKLLGLSLKLLSKRDNLRIIGNLIASNPPLHGFEYGDESMHKMLCDKIRLRLDEYFSIGEDAFFNAHPTYGTDFVAFASQYQQVVKQSGYITFDEQITLCSQLFYEHPEVLELYQDRYQYIMVDEFQDVNGAQAEFVYLLAEKHGNIVVVGDDDQSIYAFRGASHFYMLDFPNRFPEAQVVVFNDNFRSTAPLVSASQAIIKRNQSRIKKDVRAVRCSIAHEPVVIQGCSRRSIINIVSDCVSKGYSYGDIAIISSKNKVLEDLHKEVTFPNILQKSFLYQDNLFILMECIFKLKQNIHDNLAFAKIFKMVGIMDFQRDTCFKSIYRQLVDSYRFPEISEYFAYEEHTGIENELYQVLCLISNCFYIIDNSEKGSLALLEKIAAFAKLNGSSSHQAIGTLIQENALLEPYKLFSYIKDISLYGDEQKINPHGIDAVMLITAHESKGCEYPIVILLDDYKTDELQNEESRRLLYVSMTRAKDRLYVLSEHGAYAEEIGGI